MWEWLTSLFRREAGGETEKAGGEVPVLDPTQKHADLSTPRELSPVDSPTIQARLKTLGVFDFLDEHQSQALKRIILTHCRERRTEIWWWPLCEFVKTRKTHKGELPFQVIEEGCEMARFLKERLIMLEELFRPEGLQFRRIRSAEGEPLHDRAVLEDGRYLVKYRIGDTDGMLDVHVKDGKIDLGRFVAELNGLARERRWGNRLVLLPPQGKAHCVVRCNIGTAERAERSQWGRVDYPD